MKTIYFDYNATTPLNPKVNKTMFQIRKTFYGNPSSILHIKGSESNKIVLESKQKIASFIGCKDEEIIFTSGATESNNIALRGIIAENNKNIIVTSELEHPSIRETCFFLERQGYIIKTIKHNNKGLVSLKNLEAILEKHSKNIKLVSIIHGNNEIGTINDLNAIGLLCKKHNVYFHVDATQTLGKLPIDVKQMNIHLLSASAHKFYGPKGIGILYVSRQPRVTIERIIYGGLQERGLRPGTQPLDLCFGFAQALEIACLSMEKETKRLTKLQRFIHSRIKTIEASIFNGAKIGKQRLYTNLNFSFKGVEGESLMVHMGIEKFCLSSGSACTSEKLEPSHVIRAISKNDLERAHCSIRIGLGAYTRLNECKMLVQSIEESVTKLREFSPIWLSLI